jgi:type IV pilus assembly protein PilX
MRHPTHAKRAAGMVLISSMLLLLVVTILAMSMFRSYGVNEKIAGNSRDKQLALQAAQSAEAYAEAWLANNTGAGPSAVNCTGIVTAALTQVCANPLNVSTTQNATTLPWTAGVTYTPTTTNGFTNSITLSSQPVFYIYATNPASTKSWTYVIDAVGYGASPTTVAVIESYFTVTPAPTVPPG